MKEIFTGRPLAFAFLYVMACLSGCATQITDAQLERLRQDAIAQNREQVELRRKNFTQRDWQLVIQGQIETGKPVELSLPQLEALATTSVRTKEPHNTSDPNAVRDFRGVAVSTLLDRVGVAPNVTEVTFVARDAFRATVDLADLRQYPIIIALERNGRAIPRSDGGPLYLVFPYSKFPELQQKYTDRFWAFYITDLVIGTEPARLRVGEATDGKQLQYRTFDATALEQLTQVTIEETVGYRIGWPVGKVKLYGVRLRDLLAAAGLKLLPGSAVIVRGKSAIYHDTANPIRLEASDIERCDILLATHWDDNRKPIPAEMGGPVTLAPSSACKTQSDERHWVTFVEELEVKN